MPFMPVKGQTDFFLRAQGKKGMFRRGKRPGPETLLLFSLMLLEWTEGAAGLFLVALALGPRRPLTCPDFQPFEHLELH